MEAVRDTAASRLRSLCESKKWLFADRMKNEESALARLQLGDVPSLSALLDFYAAAVIVPTRNHLEAATAEVSALFEVVEVRKERNADPRAFPYDDIHVYVELGSSALSAKDDPIRVKRFEVQVRTGLQYSWWWATHDVIYKGGIQDWRAHRLASQVRANLELLDDILANLEAVAGLQPPRDDPSELDYRLLSELSEEWELTQRPGDIRRFCETALLYSRAADVSVDDLLSELRAPRERRRGWRAGDHTRLRPYSWLCSGHAAHRSSIASMSETVLCSKSRDGQRLRSAQEHRSYAVRRVRVTRRAVACAGRSPLRSPRPRPTSRRPGRRLGR